MDPKVRQYMMQKYFGAQQPDMLNGADQNVADAQKQQEMSQYAGIAASAADSLGNAFNQPTALSNRMQDLGKAPTMVGGRQQRTDMSGVQRMADNNLQGVKAERDQALQMMLQQRKEELAAQATANRQKVEDDRYNRNAQGQEASRAETARHNKAMEGKTREVDPLMGLLRAQQLEKITKENSQPPKLPVEDQKVVETLATKNAGKISIANQIDSYLKEFNGAQDEATKLRIGGQMLKVLNSPEGSDAIGVEEAKRLGDALEFQVFNITGPGPMFGRDLPGFEKQAKGTVDAVRGGIKTNQDEISRITGRGGQPAGMVKMQDATGKTFNIPANEAAEAEADGLKRI